MAQFSEILSCERQGPAYITVITMAANDLTTQKAKKCGAMNWLSVYNMIVFWIELYQWRSCEY